MACVGFRALDKGFTLSMAAQSKAFLLLKGKDDVRFPSLMSSLHAFICSIYFSCTSFHLSSSQFTTPDSGLVANQNTLAPPLRALPCLSYTLSSDLSPPAPHGHSRWLRHLLFAVSHVVDELQAPVLFYFSYLEETCLRDGKIVGRLRDIS